MRRTNEMDVYPSLFCRALDVCFAYRKKRQRSVFPSASPVLLISPSICLIVSVQGCVGTIGAAVAQYCWRDAKGSITQREEGTARFPPCPQREERQRKSVRGRAGSQPPGAYLPFHAHLSPSREHDASRLDVVDHTEQHAAGSAVGRLSDSDVGSEARRRVLTESLLPASRSPFSSYKVFRHVTYPHKDTVAAMVKPQQNSCVLHPQETTMTTTTTEPQVTPPAKRGEAQPPAAASPPAQEAADPVAVEELRTYLQHERRIQQLERRRTLQSYQIKLDQLRQLEVAAANLENDRQRVEQKMAAVNCLLDGREAVTVRNELQRQKEDVGELHPDLEEYLDDLNRMASRVTPLRSGLGWGKNGRGVAFTFETEVVSKFLSRRDLDLTCRAHRFVEDSHELFAKLQLLTLFSAPNYCGKFDNAGGRMSVDETHVQLLDPEAPRKG
ncbi:hypothetical protein HPB48_018905 [Haemaphysalis longicornis]|uniref:Serine/threonine specific protein phosphatases domain-containing protein n=1 Tax=Haemaphysalis longicornis TaxID=44386 RepID=A0A9J6G449_HAELO|nr:hypothetical protein HPB48_018905 [Haemaphysalis longicornis]